MSLARRACHIPFAVSLLAVACGGEANRPPDDLGGSVLADALNDENREARELREVEAALRARLATQDPADPGRYDTLIDHALVITRLVELDEMGEATGAGSDPDCSPAARAFGGPGRCAEGDFELVEARNELLEAIDGWPAGARNDEALLHLGALEWLRDEPEAAAVYFQRILNTYPASPYRLEACVNLGDLNFNQGAFVPAREAYDCVLDSDDVGLLAYATYKLAWIDFNLAELESALANLWQVVEWADGSAEVNPELGRVALRDMMLVYARLEDGYQRARIDLSSTLSPGELDAYLERLAELMAELGIVPDEPG